MDVTPHEDLRQPNTPATTMQVTKVNDGNDIGIFLIQKGGMIGKSELGLLGDAQ
jgi:hypothetical protein